MVKRKRAAPVEKPKPAKKCIVELVSSSDDDAPIEKPKPIVVRPRVETIDDILDGVKEPPTKKRKGAKTKAPTKSTAEVVKLPKYQFVQNDNWKNVVSHDDDSMIVGLLAAKDPTSKNYSVSDEQINQFWSSVSSRASANKGFSTQFFDKYIKFLSQRHKERIAKNITNTQQDLNMTNKIGSALLRFVLDKGTDFADDQIPLLQTGEMLEYMQGAIEGSVEYQYIVMFYFHAFNANVQYCMDTQVQILKKKNEITAGDTEMYKDIELREIKESEITTFRIKSTLLYKMMANHEGTRHYYKEVVDKVIDMIEKADMSSDDDKRVVDAFLIHFDNVYELRFNNIDKSLVVEYAFNELVHKPHHVRTRFIGNVICKEQLVRYGLEESIIFSVPDMESQTIASLESMEKYTAYRVHDRDEMITYYKLLWYLLIEYVKLTNDMPNKEDIESLRNDMLEQFEENSLKVEDNDVIYRYIDTLCSTT